MTKNETDSKLPKYTIKRKGLSTLDDVPDPCHYNPNYNSIYKKIPCVKMVKPSTSPKKVLHTVPAKPPKQKKKEMDTEESKEIQNKKKSLLPPIDYFGKNHALKFKSK